MEGIMNAQAMRMTPANAVKNLSGGVLAEDSDKGENGEIKENLDGSRVYDGTSVDLTPSTDGDGARSYIVENTETGEVLTTDPVNVGTYKATYSVAEGTNYQAGSISYEFAITEAEMKNVTANGYDGIYDGHSHGIEVSVQDELVKDEVVEYGLEPDNYNWNRCTGTYRCRNLYGLLPDHSDELQTLHRKRDRNDQAERDSGCNGRSGDNLSGRSSEVYR